MRLSKAIESDQKRWDDSNDHDHTNDGAASDESAERANHVDLREEADADSGGEEAHRADKNRLNGTAERASSG